MARVLGRVRFPIYKIGTMDNKPGPAYKFLPRQWSTVVIIGVSEPDSWVQIPGLPTIMVTIIIINFVGRRGKLLKLTDSQFPLLENKDHKGTRLGAKRTASNSTNKYGTEGAWLKARSHCETCAVRTVTLSHGLKTPQ